MPWAPRHPPCSQLIMEDVEERILGDKRIYGKHWRSYVDDTLVVLLREHLTEFFRFRNSVEKSNLFSKEEENGCLAFLDVTLRTRSDGRVNRAVSETPLTS